MSFTPEQQALVWRIGERIADEVEKVAAGRQSDCEAAAGDIYAMLATAPGAEACEWPNGRTFGFHDDPGEHDPCYVIMPDGAMLPFNHHAAPGVDIARARFVQAACNAALASSTPESAVYPGSPIIRELQAIRIGMLDHYQAATILERLVGQARSLPIPAPAEARSEQAAPPSSEEQPLHSEPQASSSCQARDEQGFSSPLPPPIREENQP